MTAISYSVGGEQLHRALHDYKRRQGPEAMAYRLELALILLRFLDLHEDCLARAAGVGRFPLVTVVPSSDRGRDHAHPLRAIAGRVIPSSARRYQHLLTRTGHPVEPREFDANRFAATRPLDGEPVLLIDDTWTTGASARSAAAALARAGAGPVACLVIGRHINRGYGDIDSRLPPSERLRFDWSKCALCHPHQA